MYDINFKIHSVKWYTSASNRFNFFKYITTWSIKPILISISVSRNINYKMFNVKDQGLKPFSGTREYDPELISWVG